MVSMSLCWLHRSTPELRFTMSITSGEAMLLKADAFRQ